MKDPRQHTSLSCPASVPIEAGFLIVAIARLIFRTSWNFAESRRFLLLLLGPGVVILIVMRVNRATCAPAEQQE